MERRKNTQKINQLIHIKIRETCGHVKVRRVKGVFLLPGGIPSPSPARPRTAMETACTR